MTEIEALRAELATLRQRIETEERFSEALAKRMVRVTEQVGKILKYLAGGQKFDA